MGSRFCITVKGLTPNLVFFLENLTKEVFLCLRDSHASVINRLSGSGTMLG